MHQTLWSALLILFPDKQLHVEADYVTVVTIPIVPVYTSKHQSHARMEYAQNSCPWMVLFPGPRMQSQTPKLLQISLCMGADAAALSMTFKTLFDNMYNNRLVRVVS